MIVSKGIKVGTLLRWSGHHVIWLLAFVGSIAALYHFNLIAINCIIKLNIVVTWNHYPFAGTVSATIGVAHVYADIHI